MRAYRKLFLSVLLLMISGTLVLSGCGEKKSAPGIQVPAKPQETSGTAEVVSQEVPMPSQEPITEERTFYDFESEDLNGWEIPAWAQGKTDHIATDIAFSEDFASKGKGSMKVGADFQGGMWATALVEIQQYLDLSQYRVIRADVYLPEGAPMGLKAKMVITVGDNWKFVEMSRSVPLVPGEWATIEANIEPGSYDWKRVVPDEKFAEDIRKIAVRVESNRKPKYTGDFYVDNVRVGR